MARKVDRRIERTQASITSAMLELVQEKEYDQITVTEIARRAGVDRKTFYLHYPSKEALMESIQDQQAKQLLDFANETVECDEMPEDERLASVLSALMEQNLDLARRIASVPSYSFLANSAKNVFKQALVEMLGSKSSLSPELVNLYSEFSAAGIVAGFIEWARNEDAVSRDEATRLIVHIMRHGIEDYLQSSNCMPDGSAAGLPATVGIQK